MRYLIILILLILSAQLAISEEIQLQRTCECGRIIQLTLKKVEKVPVKRRTVSVKPKRVLVRRKTDAEIEAGKLQLLAKGSDE